MEQYYAWFLWLTRRIDFTFGALVHSLFTRNLYIDKCLEANSILENQIK